jgi:hypothetical protein
MTARHSSPDLRSLQPGFTVSTKPAPQLAQRAASLNSTAWKVHILLVEDNEISQKLLKKQLVRAGCTVVTADDGVEAIEHLIASASSAEMGADSPGPFELILMGKSECQSRRLMPRYRNATQRWYRGDTRHQGVRSERGLAIQGTHRRRHCERSLWANTSSASWNGCPPCFS